MLCLSISARTAWDKHRTHISTYTRVSHKKNDGSFKTRTFSPNTTSFFSAIILILKQEYFICVRVCEFYFYPGNPEFKGSTLIKTDG